MLLPRFSEAETRAFNQIMRYMSLLSPDPAMADTVAETLYSILVREYNLELSSDQFKELVTHQTTAIYQELVRADATMPRVDFGLADLRAMDYLAKSDLVYLGKYVNDEALKVRILEYLRVHYAGEGRAIGNSPKEIQAFLDEFRDELDLTKYQLRRIIDTTVSRARVFGQVNGLRAAGAKTFEIAGPYDNLTCPFCKTMVGRVFSVAVEIADQDKFINAGPEGASAIRPFLKGSLTLEQIEEMGDEALQAAGFAAPPYHPVCRHRLIVRDFYENLDEIPYAIE